MQSRIPDFHTWGYFVVDILWDKDQNGPVELGEATAQTFEVWDAYTWEVVYSTAILSAAIRKCIELSNLRQEQQLKLNA